jgi:hypothetical protein
MMKAAETAPSSAPAQPQAVAYRALVARGLAPEEAANVLAVLAGIPIVEHPWTLRQLSHLRFLLWLRRSGRWDPETVPTEP